ncbi:unnamed protein product [Gongylonema pulchrum]|uniref:Sulfate_transp domain-containing protein n=1 Tax=Gongylonema pulchrum TaxID=637853 RepID=A0A183F0Z4_9BILA|nr:unnamed protein product [Gongylonema pulchrum]
MKMDLLQAYNQPGYVMPLYASVMGLVCFSIHSGGCRIAMQVASLVSRYDQQLAAQFLILSSATIATVTVMV